MRLPLNLPLFCLFVFTVTGQAQFKFEGPAGEAPGRWICATVGVNGGAEGAEGAARTTALRGLAIRLGEESNGGGVAYDLDLGRVAGFWGGRFVTPMNLMSRGDYPTALGETLFVSKEAPGMGVEKAPWRDPRPEPFGPLPEGQVRCRGFHVFEGRVILEWAVGDRQVLEEPKFVKSVGGEGFVREFRFGASEKPVRVSVAPRAAEMTAEISGVGANFCKLVQEEGEWVLDVEPTQESVRVNVWVGRTIEGAQAGHKWAGETNFEAVLRGGRGSWPHEITTVGEVSSDRESAYVVDTLKLPEENPWKAPMFVGGLDFFPDGRIAFCTFHGDIWVGSGVDAGLSGVKWRRFASGLYHPLGLRIVNGEIYVAGRDGITRLKDVNGDGEADFYEAFNHEVKVTQNFHEFVFDLQTDLDGNFYFVKAGPVRNGGRGFEQIMAHHGALLKVSPDGSKLETVATGFRAPNGLGCGPAGELTSGDNEGTWTPACRLNWIRPGGFYGVVDLAHREPVPTDYDRPLCWIPKRVDNSSGGQVWVQSDKWGPWSGRLLHMSYGTCSLFGVLKEEVDGTVQGGLTRFPLKFQSGIMRARVHPLDGQVYVGGLRGWQTSALRNGCIQRVRYTGAPMVMPVAVEAFEEGIQLRFDVDLETKAAADAESYQVEVWNYVWSQAYGSPEVSTLAPAEAPSDKGKTGEAQFTKAQMAKTEHDPLEVKSATVSTDERSVFLKIPGMRPAMQMCIKYDLKSAEGTEMRGEVLNTIHRLGR
jgi:hypothetical protein